MKYYVQAFQAFEMKAFYKAGQFFQKEVWYLPD
jgi:hypothetical protein